MVRVRSLLSVVLLLAGCTAPVDTSSASPSATLTAAPSPTFLPTASRTPTPLPSAASGGVEVFATGRLHGTYIWVVGEVAEAQDRVTESLYAVPLDGSPARLVVRRLRPRGVPGFGGQSSGGIVLLRQVSADGTKLALEQSTLGPAAHDGFVVVDMANGSITELARGDAQADTMPAWSPDGTQIAFARRTTTPGAPDDGLWVIRADGSAIRRILPGSCCAQLTRVYGWTADGAGIAFAVTFEGADYSIANVASGVVTGPHGQVFGLTPATWRVQTPQFAGAFSQGDKGGEQRIDVADGIGKAPRTVWHEPSDFGNADPLLLNARWSPIGDEILFLRSGSDSKVVRVAATGGAARDVPTVDQPTKAEWLPDGRVVYISKAKGIPSYTLAPAVVRVTDGTRDSVLLPFPQTGVMFTDLAVRTYP
jgi:dipeptidyl aminopeptidase/acylaminoacyl peptidase